MKTYTEEQLIEALKYQKAEDYQVAGGLLINDKPNISGALEHLANDEPLSIEQIDDFLKE